MFEKIAFIALILTVSSSQISGGAVKPFSWSDTETALDNLRASVYSALNDVFQNDYTKAGQNIDSIVWNYLSNGSEIITSATDDYVVQYQAIKEEAEASGIDITDCVTRLEDLILNLGPENLEGFQTCLNGHASDALDAMLVSSQNIIQNSLSFPLFSMEKEMLACNTDESCLSSVAVEMARQGGMIVGKITQLVQADISRLGMYTGPMVSCGQKYVSIAVGKGQSLLESFQTCVSEAAIV